MNNRIRARATRPDAQTARRKGGKMATPSRKAADNMQPLHTYLREHKQTLAVAESCTGGLIGAAITALPGSSEYFKGGIIAYSNEVKTSLLKVSSEVLKTHGAVSRECAEAMARGVKQLMNVDCAIAVTGIAGPGGGTFAKPVGLIYICINSGDIFEVVECRFAGDRESIRQETVEMAIGRLLKLVTL